jgi:biopolymer transport protein TolR
MRRPRRLKHEINVVPYIDVMLVLLVIFMVTAPMIQQGSIDLPSVGKMSAPPSEALVVTVDADGSMSIRARDGGPGKETIGRLGLAERIKELKVKHPDQSVLIAGDKNAKYEAILKVLDDLRGMEVKVSLQVQGK